MKHVAILTNFVGYDKKYSLCNVASEQVQMLKRNNYKVTVIVNEGFKPEEPFTEDILKFVPNVRVYNEVKLDDTWEKDCNEIAEKLKVILKDVDSVFTHDLIYQPAYLKMNVAARKVAEEYPNIQWLHWIHSATTPTMLGRLVLGEGKDKEYLSICRMPFPNSFVIYPNKYEIPRVAANMGYEEDYIKTVNHSTDPAEFFDFHPISREIVKQRNMYSADVIGCYPLRLDRGKQPECVIEMFAAIKRFGRSVRLVFCDFHSTGGDKVVFRNELKDLAIKRGLNSTECFFTSSLAEETQCGVPRKVVRDMMLISNLFVMPSRSETYSLIAQEAALCKNLLVLNYDFPPMRSIYGEDPLYAKFGSNIDALTGMDGNTNVEYTPDFQSYCDDWAKKICYYLENERCISLATKIRKKRNPQAIFKRQIEPLLYRNIK